MVQTDFLPGKLLKGIMVTFLLLNTSFPEVQAQTIMFDDFTYTGVNDPQLSTFNKWDIVDGQSGPPEGALYSKNNIAFVVDPNNASNKLMTLSTTVNGTTKATTHSRIESSYEYFEGTYAARVYITDQANVTKDANIQTFFTIVPSSYAGDGTQYSELDIVEYMAADKWGVSPDNPVLYTTSYHKYIANPWQAWKTYFASKKSWAGWHTFIASCTDGVNVKYWIDDTYLGSQSVTDAETQAGLSVYPRRNMQIAFANWIWNNVVGSSTANRTNTMQADWTLFYKSQELSLTQINTLVSGYRTQGLQRRNLAGQTYITASTNQAPNVSLTAPVNNATFTAPASIIISANATDADGTVSKVEFYNGTTLLNSDATAPYSFAWTNVATGTYNITAKATDNLGATKTSAVATVTVTTVVNQAPTITLTGPANNAIFIAPASITISANATDADGTISKVEFYNGTTLLNSDATAPYSFAWTNVAAGTYSITAKATDNAGATKTSAVATVTVNPVTLSQSPYGGSPANIPGTMQAENYDLGGQAIAFNDVTTANEGAAYRTDAVDIEAVNTGGFNVGWTAAGEWLEYTVNVTAGTYKIDARLAATATGKSFRIEMDGATIATFSVPNTTGWQTWQTVTINNVALTAGQKVMRIYCITDGFNIDNLVFSSVSNPPVNIVPTVSLTAPTNNASYTAPASINIAANANDADGTVAKVEFFNGTTLLNSDVTSPYSFVWTNVAVGSYTITAKATDNAGAVTTSSPVSVTVTSASDTQAPTVSITAPANSTTYNAPASISIAANASDNVGVTKVEFYNGTTLLNSDATAPYSFPWTNVAAGTYSITAKAYDAAGNTKTSTPVSVTVNTVTTGGCIGIAQYIENGGYVAGSKVQNAGSQYQCKPYPYAGWCNGAAWAYGAGTGAYWSDAWTLIGSCNAKAADDNTTAIVNDNVLSNSPNPFSGNTNIEVTLAEAGEANLVVFDQAGHLITTLSEGTLSAGTHSFTFDAAYLNPGMYIVKCTTNNAVITRKIVKTQ